MSDELLKQLIAQAPAIVLLIMAIKVLYYDAKEDRAQAARERALMIERLEGVEIQLARVERACGADLLPPMPKNPL